MLRNLLIIVHISEAENLIYLFKKNLTQITRAIFSVNFLLKPLEGFNGVKNTGCWCNQQVIQGLIFHSETRVLQINKSF